MKECDGVEVSHCWLPNAGACTISFMYHLPHQGRTASPKRLKSDLTESKHDSIFHVYKFHLRISTALRQSEILTEISCKVVVR